MKSLFRNPVDRARTAIVFLTTGVSVALYALVDNPWILLGYWVLMLVPRGGMSAWNHHHQHCFTFRSTALNRAVELCYGLHTGMTTHVWLLHHVLGHHINYLDQTKDESRWMRADGTKMGLLEYVLVVSGTAYGRAYAVGHKHPKHQRVLVQYSLLMFGLVAALIAYRPIPGLIVFALPMVSTLLWTSWATYDHHAGLTTDDPYAASYNLESPLYNFVSANLGLHTAHHLRPGVHWSKLPELHATIRHKIPDRLCGPWQLTRPAQAAIKPASAAARSGGEDPSAADVDARLADAGLAEAAASPVDPAATAVPRSADVA